jgi:hypothetical protein
MTGRARGRTQVCGRSDALTRLAYARKALEVAEVTATEDEIPESASVAAALAVLAGIAGADAACCAALGRRSRGQDHHEAEALVAEIEPGGPSAASALRRLLDLKDTAHYGLIPVSRQKLSSAMRQAANLIEFAASVARR